MYRMKMSEHRTSDSVTKFGHLEFVCVFMHIFTWSILVVKKVRQPLTTGMVQEIKIKVPTVFLVTNRSYLSSLVRKMVLSNVRNNVASTVFR